MKYFLKTIRYMLCLSIVIFIFACSNNITTNIEQRTSSIIRGDSICLKWNFSNADIVYISKIPEKFNGIDSFIVSPENTTTYDIYAYRDKKEISKIQWKINVVNQLKSGFDIFDLTDLDSSTKQSNYLVGVNNNSIISAIKIIGIENPNNLYNPTIKFIPLDKYGNYISEIDFGDTSVINYIQIDNNKSIKTILQSISEKKTFITDSNKFNFYFCIDNSQASTNTIYNQLLLLSKEYHLSDNFFITTFNQNITPVLPIQKDSNYTFNPLIYNDNQGINAANNALYNLINYINSKTIHKNDIIILITKSNDNASIFHTEQEIVKIAKEHNIKLYVVAIGETIPTYNFEYLANATGGSLYILNEKEILDLYNVLHEILFVQKFYYRAKVSIPYKFDFNEDLILNLSLKDTNNSNIIYNNYTLPSKHIDLFSNYKTLAIFNNKSTKIQEEFYSNLQALADTLNKHKDLTIKLIGHAHIDNIPQVEINKIALNRAQNIRRKIIEFGANPSQIRISSECNYYPVYAQPNEIWQQDYNNRVELFWLIPQEQPYEIIAGTANSENLAKKEVEKFNNYGFKAYYERLNLDTITSYRIFIWGYSTEDEALKAKEELTKLFKYNFKIR